MIDRLKRNTICEDLQLVSEHRWYEKWLFQKVNTALVQNYFLQLQGIFIFLQIHLHSRFRTQAQSNEQPFISTPHILLGRFQIQWKTILSNKFVTENNNNIPVTHWLTVLNVKVFKPTNNVIGSLNLGNVNQAAAILPFSYSKWLK